jgi:hypothetical protein
MDAAQVSTDGVSNQLVLILFTSRVAPHTPQVLSVRSQEFCSAGLQDCLHPFSSACADPNDRRCQPFARVTFACLFLLSLRYPLTASKGQQPRPDSDVAHGAAAVRTAAVAGPQWATADDVLTQAHQCFYYVHVHADIV